MTPIVIGSLISTVAIAIGIIVEGFVWRHHMRRMDATLAEMNRSFDRIIEESKGTIRR